MEVSLNMSSIGVGSICLMHAKSCTSKWLYIMLDKEKAFILQGLSKMLPLKIRVSDYGRVIISGEGDFPPDYIRRNIYQCDLTRKPGVEDYEIYYIPLKDRKTTFTNYIITCRFRFLSWISFLERYSKGEAFDITEYGNILHSGWGKPSEEVFARIEEIYGVVTPIMKFA